MRTGTCLILCLVASLLILAAPGAAPVGRSFPIRAEADDEWHPTIAYNSQWQEYVVVLWNDRPGNDDLRAERVSRHGRLLGGRWLAAGPGADRRHPDVAYNSKRNEYLVVWEEEWSGESLIRSQRFSADLEPMPEGSRTLSADPIANVVSKRPAVAYAFTADKYLVAWDRHTISPGRTHIMGAVVNADGDPQMGGAFVISEDPGDEHRREPDLAYNRHANGFLVVWQQVDSGNVWDIHGQLVNGDGSIPPSFQPITIADDLRDCTMPAVAAIPTAPGQYKYLVVWEYAWSPPADTHIRGRLVGEGGAPHPTPMFIATEPVAETVPAVAGSEMGHRYLVAWTQAHPGTVLGSFIGAREVSSAGAMTQEPRGIWGPWADNAAVSAGHDGDFLVAFDDTPDGSRDVYGLLWGTRVYLPLVLRRR